MVKQQPSNERKPELTTVVKAHPYHFAVFELASEYGIVQLTNSNHNRRYAAYKLILRKVAMIKITIIKNTVLVFAADQ